MDAVITKAVEIVRNGGIIIFPTDTAFGIGCRMDDRRAVDRLFSVRRRPRTHAVPVLVSSIAMALTYFKDPSPVVRRLMDTHWPGALTIVFTCTKNDVYSPIRGGLECIGLRMPDHIVPLSLIDGIGMPILGPSANFHSHPTPYTYDSIDPKLKELADFVVPGECRLGIVSTVVDCTDDPFRIVRQGAIAV